MNFAEWLDALAPQLPREILACNLNLYETSSDTEFDVQLVCCDSYDPEDDDWACFPVYSSEENVFTLSADDWEEALEDIVSQVQLLLASCSETHFLKRVTYLTAGFVDGDLVLIHKKEN